MLLREELSGWLKMKAVSSNFSGNHTEAMARNASVSYTTVALTYRLALRW